MKILKIKLILILFLFSSYLYAFSRSSDLNGNIIYFKQINNLEIDYDLNSIGVGEEEISNFLSQFSVQLKSNLGINVLFKNGLNDSPFLIRTSREEGVFTSNSVAGITKISFKDSGEIVGAEIILNLDVALSNDQFSYNYFGNVISHEIGHLLGLDHSTAFAATMIAHLNPGQHTWEEDDVSGGLSSLGLNFKFKGTISGNILGFNPKDYIFGTVVDLIRLKDFKIIQSQISDEFGQFVFRNVDKSEKYIIAFGPYNFRSGFSTKYSKSFNGFCHNRDNYIYTTLSSCLPSYNEVPTIISFEDSNYLEIGDLGIKCDVEISKVLNEFILNNRTAEINFDELNENSTNIFLNGLLPNEEKINIPIIIDDVNPGEFLRIGILSQLIKSNFLISPIVENKTLNIIQDFSSQEHNQSKNNFQYPSYEGLPNYNFVGNIELSAGVNQIDISLTPIKLRNLIENDFQGEFTDQNFVSGFMNPFGNFLLFLSIGSLDAEGNFIPRNKIEGPRIANDIYSCSSAINSFSFSNTVVQNQNVSTKNNFEVSSRGLGCDANASENGNFKNQLHYFILEILLYLIAYLGVRYFLSKRFS